MMIVFLLHCAATLFMTGLIWFVQVVHYPLFANVGAAEFLAYQQAHMRLTSLVVLPPMLMELAGAGILAMAPPAGVSKGAVWCGLLLVLIIWASTALLQVPRHGALVSHGFDAGQHLTLVASNWIRTVAWTARSALVLWMLYALMPPNLPTP
ncbi:MAG: hypothetical protein AAFV53_31930 [Myxococcota bacterium]